MVARWREIGEGGGPDTLDFGPSWQSLATSQEYLDAMALIAILFAVVERIEHLFEIGRGDQVSSTVTKARWVLDERDNAARSILGSAMIM